MFVLYIHPPYLLISTTILTTKLRSWRVLVKRPFHLRTYPMISFAALEHVLYETWEVRTRYLYCSSIVFTNGSHFFWTKSLWLQYSQFSPIFSSLNLIESKISKKTKQVWQSVQEWELSSYHTTFLRKCLPRQPLTYPTGRLITRLATKLYAIILYYSFNVQV